MLIYTVQKSLYVLMISTLPSEPSSYLQTHLLHSDANISLRRLQGGSCCCKCFPGVLSGIYWAPQGLCYVFFLNLVLSCFWILWSLDYFTTSETTQTSFCNLITFRSKTSLCFHFHLAFLVSFNLDFMRPAAGIPFSSILSDLGFYWIWASFSLSQFLP